jgi:hypothetical protein
MSGWTRKINWNHWMRLKVLALALVSLAVFAGPASAKPSEIPYLSHGIGVSSVEQGAQFTLNTSGTDPYLQDWAQVQSEQAYQTSTTAEVSSGGVTPTNLARAYVPQDEVVAASVGGRSFELGDAALGFGLGLLLAAVCAVAIVHSRRGVRMAHS